MVQTTRRGSFRGKISYNAAQQRSRSANYGHLLLPRGVNVFKEEPGGRISLDILPYFVTDPHHPDRDEEREIAVEGTLWYRRPYKLHRAIGVSNDSIVCPTSIGKKCPICEYRAKQLSEGAKWQDEAIKAMRPSSRNLYYVVPKGSGKHEEKAYLWDMSQFLFQDALNNELEENEEFGDFPDLENGFILRIRFSEEKFERNSFAKTSRIDFEQRTYAYSEDVVRELTSLDECLDIKDYREVEKLFFEAGNVDDDSEEAREEKETPSPTPTRSLSRPKGTAEIRSISEPVSPPQPIEEAEVVEPIEPVKTVVVRRPLQKPGAASSDKASSPVASTVRVAAPSGECPSGYRFGVDVDTKSECEECPVWGDCFDAKEAAA